MKHSVLNELSMMEHNSKIQQNIILWREGNHLNAFIDWKYDLG